jgi:hypothetical protein
MKIEAKQRLMADEEAQKEAINTQIEQKRNQIEVLKKSLENKDAKAKIPVQKNVNRLEQDILNLKQRKG